MNLRNGVLLAAVAAVLGGCGVGGILLGSAGGGGGGGSSQPAPPQPFMNVSLPGGEVGSNLVSFRVRLIDVRVDLNERDPRVRLVAEFSVGGGDFRPMTEAQIAESEGLRALTLSGEHTFVWNSIVDVGGATGDVDFRFSATYEEVEGIGRKFKAFSDRFRIDNRLAGTILGVETREDSDVDTFPIDLRPDGDGFLVASLGANIVERVGPTGRVDRVVGLGVPGSIMGTGQAPGVARLPLIFGVDHDAAGNVYTTHDASIVVTNRGMGPITFGLLDEQGAAQPDTTVVPPQTAATVLGQVRLSAQQSAQLGPPLSFARGIRLHPSGAVIFLNLGAELFAVNPRDPSLPGSLPIVLGGISIAPGAVTRLAGGGTRTDDGAPGTESVLADANALTLGPDGEIYVSERTPARVRVFNAASAALTIGGFLLQPGAVATAAGGNGPGYEGDGGAPSQAMLNEVGGIDVSADRVLFLADTRNLVVRAANLGTTDVEFAGTPIAAGTIETVIGGGTAGGVGSKALEFALEKPNGVALDAIGNALVADGHRVLLVNGTTSTVTAYGTTAGAARVGLVYDATDRGGLLLVEPRAMTAVSAEVLYFTDRSSVRVMNLGSRSAVFGGASADPGASSIVGGGAVTGFAGDNGPARVAAFSSPSAIASEGPFLLYVADTDNHRIRALNVDDPRIGVLGNHTALGVPVAAGNVVTVVGGGLPGLPLDGDGLAPTAANLSFPQGVAVSNGGLLFIADTGHHRIRVVNPGPGDVTVAGLLVTANTIRTVVGDGVPGFTPDGVAPWHVDTPTALAIDRDLLYFTDAGNARIRVLNLSDADVTLMNLTVHPSEVLTICGSGVRGNSGDFGLGVEALIDTPRGLALQTLNGERAALYFADGPQHVIRMLNLTSDTDLVGALNAAGAVAITVPDSSIFSLAGGPNMPGFPNAPGFDGDGDEAARMRFAEPWGVAVTTFAGAPAHFFVADSRNNRIRRFGAPPLVR